MDRNNITDSDIQQAYNRAIRFTRSHYENFPVVSLFIPEVIRKDVAVVYQFARQADDIADEPLESLPDNISGEQFRIEKLGLYKKQLEACLNGEYSSDFWAAFHHTVVTYQLDPNCFYDLLSAFEQDVVKKRYSDFEELLDYCRRSANPVGRIILQLFGVNDSDALRYSDSVCTALQLTNFYQDLALDYGKGRIYIPLNELEKFGVSENLFELKKNNTNFISLLKYQVDRAQKLFDDGRNLLPLLPDRLFRQIQLTILGGEAILRKIENINYDVLQLRPKLKKFDIINLLIRAFLNVGR